MKILYAGDGPLGGAANYLIGVLNHLRARWRHVPPTQTLNLRTLQVRYDAIVLSDFPCDRLPVVAQRAIAERVAHGMGLLMVGGWASFAGPSGRWRGSPIEAVLPVACRRTDDRLQFPSGALIVQTRRHPLLRAIPFHRPPMICGMNAVQPKTSGAVLLSARKLLHGIDGRVSLERVAHPLLIIDRHPQRRIAALATDVAPHWCGGMVDWGDRRLRIPVQGRMQIEVGNQYVRFVSSLIRWLAGHF